MLGYNGNQSYITCILNKNWMNLKVSFQVSKNSIIFKGISKHLKSSNLSRVLSYFFKNNQSSSSRLTRLIMGHIKQTKSFISIYIHIYFKHFIFLTDWSFFPSMVQESIRSSQNSFQSKTYYCHWSYHPLSYIIHN